MKLVVVLGGELLRETKIDTSPNISDLVFGVTDEEIERSGSVEHGYLEVLGVLGENVGVLVLWEEGESPFMGGGSLEGVRDTGPTLVQGVAVLLLQTFQLESSAFLARLVDYLLVYGGEVVDLEGVYLVHVQVTAFS